MRGRVCGLIIGVCGACGGCGDEAKPASDAGAPRGSGSAPSVVTAAPAVEKSEVELLKFSLTSAVKDKGSERQARAGEARAAGVRAPHCAQSHLGAEAGFAFVSGERGRTVDGRSDGREVVVVAHVGVRHAAQGRQGRADGARVRRARGRVGQRDDSDSLSVRSAPGGPLAAPSERDGEVVDAPHNRARRRHSDRGARAPSDILRKMSVDSSDRGLSSSSSGADPRARPSAAFFFCASSPRSASRALASRRSSRAAATSSSTATTAVRVARAARRFGRRRRHDQGHRHGHHERIGRLLAHQHRLERRRHRPAHRVLRLVRRSRAPASDATNYMVLDSPCDYVLASTAGRSRNGPSVVTW